MASARLVPARTNIWAGEIFSLSYEITVARSTNPQVSPIFEWNPAPLFVEDWSKPEGKEVVSNDARWVSFIFNTRAVAPVSGKMRFAAATHLINIQTRSTDAGRVSQPRMEPVSVTCDQPVIEVRPLPGGAPAGFSGAVGQFTLNTQAIPEKVAVGEPIAWTLILHGTGNWTAISGLPPREVSNDFEVVMARPKRTSAKGMLLTASLTEDAVLFPSRPGTHTLGSASFVSFDSNTGEYQILTTPAINVTVTSGPPTPPVLPPQPRPYPLAKPGTRRIGGETRMAASQTDPASNIPTNKLEEVRRRNSPTELFHIMNKAEGKAGDPTGKD